VIVMHLPTYLTLLASAEQTLATSYRHVAAGHPDEPEVAYPCTNFAHRCDRHADALAPTAAQYKDRRSAEPDRLRPPGPVQSRHEAIGMLRDLQDLYQLANLVDSTWTLIGQAAAGARDRTLLDVVATCHPQITTQLAWLRMRMQAAAPQTLLVAP
jgi:hypothetical protein